MRIGCSGLVRPHTGIGVVQTHLYSDLRAAGCELGYSATRDVATGWLRSARGLARGLRPAARPWDAYLSAVPPLPFGVGPATVAIVCDLRWQRTRGYVARAYRRWDLWRTVKTAAIVVCISARTRDDLIRAFPAVRSKVRVARLGPGIVSPEAAAGRVKTSGSVLLIGGAAHKGNERAARLLGAVDPSWCNTVIGVGVSPEVRRTCEDAFGAARCDWHARPSDQEMREIYARSEYFLFLGKEEGFGLPYVEALCSGCTVLAIDQPLTRELLRDGAVLLPDSSDDELAVLLAAEPRIDAEKRESVAGEYSWQGFSAAILHALSEVANRDARKQPSASE